MAKPGQRTVVVKFNGDASNLNNAAAQGGKSIDKFSAKVGQLSVGILAGAGATVAVRDRASACISPGGRVVASTVVCGSGAVPGSISVIRPAVVHHRGTSVPATVPTAISPSATTIIHHCANRNSDSERNHGGRHHGRSAVSRRDVRRSVHDRRVVHRDVNYLRIRGLNHDDLRRLLLSRSCFPPRLSPSAM